MSDFIIGSLCLSNIPKDKIRMGKDGKKYLNICIASRREPDQYENTHTIYVSQSEDERNAKAKKSYIGMGRMRNQQPVAATPEDIDRMPPAEDVDDLPF